MINSLPLLCRNHRLRFDFNEFYADCCVDVSRPHDSCDCISTISVRFCLTANAWQHTLKKLLSETCTCVGQSGASFFWYKFVARNRTQLYSLTETVQHVTRTVQPNWPDRCFCVQETEMNLRQIFRASFWYQFLERVSVAWVTALWVSSLTGKTHMTSVWIRSVMTTSRWSLILCRRPLSLMSVRCPLALRLFLLLLLRVQQVPLTHPCHRQRLQCTDISLIYLLTVYFLSLDLLTGFAFCFLTGCKQPYEICSLTYIMLANLVQRRSIFNCAELWFD